MLSSLKEELLIRPERTQPNLLLMTVGPEFDLIDSFVTMSQ